MDSYQSSCISSLLLITIILTSLIHLTSAAVLVNSKRKLLFDPRTLHLDSILDLEKRVDSFDNTEILFDHTVQDIVKRDNTGSPFDDTTEAIRSINVFRIIVLTPWQDHFATICAHVK